MKRRSVHPLPIALVATHLDEVRDFLTVHLEDRGFSVEVCHRVEYLETVAPYADVCVCDVGYLHAASAVEPSPGEIVALSETPSDGERAAVERLGACDYFALPFDDTERLASVLDALASRATERKMHQNERELEAEPVA